MSPLSGTLAQIAQMMELYLKDPLGEEYWICCNNASEVLMDDVEKVFLATCTNFKIAQISWMSIHVQENWAAFFSSAVMHTPLEGF